MNSLSETGTLYIVATPMGNLADMTFRAVDTLKEVDLIAAEDTRHSRKLLTHYHIQTRLVSCHEHNETGKIPYFLEQLKKGKNIALISDAGTPAISDPGYPLVSSAVKEEIRIIPIPGCSAAIAGLSASGLPTDSFLFLGFLPKKKQRLKQILLDHQHQPATLIFYESPKRITALVQNIIDCLGDRPACLAREITKRHEEFIRGNLSTILGILAGRETIKGECSLFVSGQKEKETLSEDELEHIVSEHLETTDLKTSELARLISSRYQLPKNSVYEMILRLS